MPTPLGSDYRRVRYVPELDSIRGVAMITVYLAHLWIIWPSWTFSRTFADGGFIGVDVFFVLSGFLITGLLLDEQARTRAIRLGAFYGRRALRLLPALWFGVAAYLLYARANDYPPFHSSALTFADTRATLLFGMNWQTVWHPTKVADFTALWSLSLEAQFYVVWPLVVVTLVGLHRSTRTVVSVIVGLFVVISLRRLQLFETQGWFAAYLRSDSHVDGLVLGSLVACAWVRGWTPDRLPRWLSWAAWAGLAGLLLVLRADARVTYAGGTTLVLLAGAVLVLVAVTTGRQEQGPIGRVTGLVGRLSYGIYLWHFPVLWAAERWGRGWSDEARLGSSLAVTAVGVAISRVAVELPALALKGRRRPPAGWTPPSYAGPGSAPPAH